MPLAVELFQYQAHVDHLERVYQSPEYTIDWPAVRAGTEAGLPGLWVSQPVTVTTHWLHDMSLEHNEVHIDTPCIQNGCKIT